MENVNFMDVNGVSSTNGTLVTLKLRVKDDASIGDASIAMTFTAVGDSRGSLNSTQYNNVQGKVVIQEFTYGDADGDGDADIFDSLHLARHLAEWPEYKTISPGADVNGVEGINIFDSLYLARHLAEWPGYVLPGPAIN